ncbi:Autophagy- protein 9A [Perkinsus olseni]|uniref:Autophagy- protein 9A n=1 Tax=Perkinsus olseni TaxID=32597 RepID=A0A7J6S439_PEROL|nr:Autophagy- protein 9A [Perkinsus olseni]
MQDETVKSQVADTKAMSNVAALDRFYTMLKNDPERAVYGPGPVTKAAEMGAIDELLITDGLFRSSSVGVRKRYVALVEEVQATSNVFIFSTQHVSGEQLQNLAGIAATLKFPCPDLDDEYALTEQEALGSSDDEDRDGTAGSSELDDNFLAGI